MHVVDDVTLGQELFWELMFVYRFCHRSYVSCGRSVPRALLWHIGHIDSAQWWIRTGIEAF